MEAKAGDDTAACLTAGTIVERDIDGSWFPAKIEHIDNISRMVMLKYLDDDNEEKDVPLEEIRLLQSGTPNLKPAVVSSLPRPLQGLIEDDEEIRKTHQPRVVVHNGHELPEGTVRHSCSTSSLHDYII